MGATTSSPGDGTSKASGGMPDLASLKAKHEKLIQRLQFDQTHRYCSPASQEITCMSLPRISPSHVQELEQQQAALESTESTLAASAVSDHIANARVLFCGDAQGRIVKWNIAPTDEAAVQMPPTEPEKTCAQRVDIIAEKLKSHEGDLRTVLGQQFYSILLETGLDGVTAALLEHSDEESLCQLETALAIEQSASEKHMKDPQIEPMAVGKHSDTSKLGECCSLTC